MRPDARVAIAWLAAVFLFTAAPQSLADTCASDGARVQSGVSVQILGSGGPFAGAGRASSSYLVWVDGRARVLVDVGGGSFLRFGEARARLGDLRLVAITHLHPDHVSDLPALLWLSEYERKERLAIAGPSGNAVAPAFPEFLRRLFDDKTGAFPMLSGTVGGSGHGVPLDASAVDISRQEPTTVFDKEGVTVTAIGVPHGTVPALAYRVRAGGKSIVFSGDQTGADPRFTALAKDADVLVMHLAIAAGETNPAHASPAAVGQVARAAGVKRLIVSHFGPESALDALPSEPVFNLERAVAEVKRYYNGPLTVGADLHCTAIP